MQTHVLGSVNADLSAGCTGNAAGNGGRCLIYKEAYFGEAAQPIPWVQKLEAAAAAQEQAEAAQQQIEQINDQLDILNNTAAAHIVNTKQVDLPEGSQRPADTQVAKTKQQESEKECNSKDKEPECTANPKCK
ncbi:Trypanosomal VSG domain containing protein [Trypanosoma brucei equiperdum]|uniref:Trypanosomal VSG domain containing protein n=1 Tax=Trypanosoma brucei equiperdum TaxID=630700 RepID=A0A3L6LAH8_9TRYP|nr:Trypanosomal VSG domain containing protein [Trypanosoma brucei equiperdum]